MPVLVSLFEGQICQRCHKPVSRHKFTGLGAVVCLDMPQNAGLAPWYAHKFVTLDGKPYFSIMEQIGDLAGTIEERGLPEAFEPAMAEIRHLVSRLAGCLVKDVKPYKEWFVVDGANKEQIHEEVPK